MTDARGSLIVWDWNGTILADSAACLRATNKVLETLGLPRTSMPIYRDVYTMPFQRTYAALGVTDVMMRDLYALNTTWHETYSASKIRLRRGVKDALSAVANMNCSSVILSNYLTDHIATQAKDFGVENFFDSIIAFKDGERAKTGASKGDKLQAFLETQARPASIIVGDSVEEIHIGRNFGMTTIAVTHGTCSEARLRAEKPDFVVSSLGQVPEIITRLQPRLAS